jgi:holin-like protein
MMVHFEHIASEWLSISIALLLSTVVTMAATAGIMLGVSRLLAREHDTDG